MNDTRKEEILVWNELKAFLKDKLSLESEDNPWGIPDEPKPEVTGGRYGGSRKRDAKKNNEK